MSVTRREFLAMRGVAVMTMNGGVWSTTGAGGNMYGLIAKMKVAEGKRDDMISVLLESTANMPGCLSYVIAKDATDPNAIWVTEAWDSQACHDASLSLPAVKNAIVKAKPLVVGFERFITEPVGGHGLIGNSRAYS